jgi:hypothetical protein
MATSKRTRAAKGGSGKVAEGYTHPDQSLLMRPEVGTQSQFRKKKPPVTRRGDDVPCWMLDADYHGLCFRASQVFFPRTAAWDSRRKALKADYDETVWDHLAGARSAPFEAGEQKQVAVQVIDDRGNELLVVEPLP